ncbi:WbqC family protein [Rhodothermus profundi]|uniref:WbqC-like protein family protein n=1 Tax=Rhodothermus profundi TaxID=633813 RepID=A0A1M6PET5_9BACT|nr:WbqC family protein [Rhodothermus profundi]SHK06465.1 WbqC-like protein family protein [Rhodothermus profundi]
MLAVVPPEYFPRLERVALALRAGRLVLADTFQYSRQSFHNRTRLRNPQGWQWISVPLRAHQHGVPIDQAAVGQLRGWQRRHWRAFCYNYRTTPYFEFFEPRLEEIFQQEWTTLGALTCATVLLTLQLFEIDTPVVRASELVGRPASVAAIARVLAADTLLLPENTAAIDRTAAAQVYALRFKEPVYRQNFEGFVPGMTALDLLFNLGPIEARALLEAHSEVMPV